MKDKTLKAAAEHHISDDVLEMAKTIEKNLKLDAKTGIVEVGENLYEKTLPETITLETATAVANHNANFVAAGSLAVGTMAVEAMKSNNSLERVSGEIPMVNKDSLKVSVERQKDFVNNFKRDEKGNPEKGVNFGVVTSSLEIRADRNAGDLKKVRSLIGDMALEAFGK